MRLAIVVGGWHWPLHPFVQFAIQAPTADRFVIAHRHPELPIVREEKRAALAAAPGPLGDLDRDLYREFATVDELRKLDWIFEEAPNTVGDWGFFNQWLSRYGYRRYDVILNCHDDTYIRRAGLFDCLYPSPHPSRARAGFSPPGGAASNWLILANGHYPQAPAGYVRGSFEFWKSEMLDLLGGRIDLGDIALTREGLTDTPEDMNALSSWNGMDIPLRRFLASRNLTWRIASLSPHYRVSPWVIEGERGFLHKKVGAPWSFEAGLQAFPLFEPRSRGVQPSGRGGFNSEPEARATGCSA